MNETLMSFIVVDIDYERAYPFPNDFIGVTYIQDKVHPEKFERNQYIHGYGKNGFLEVNKTKRAKLAAGGTVDVAGLIVQPLHEGEIEF
jgi:hypothetical protein